MISNLSSKKIRKKFKRIFYEEFDDANEEFMDFMLNLIPKKVLIKVIQNGRKSYYSRFYQKKNEEQKEE